MTDAPREIWVWPDGDGWGENNGPDWGTYGGFIKGFNGPCHWMGKNSAKYIRADLAFPRWQPIETAPRDGTRVRGFWQYTYPEDGERTYGERVIEWHEELCGWLDDEREVHTRGAEDNTGLFTHWMPLLEPPVKVTERA